MHLSIVKSVFDCRLSGVRTLGLNGLTYAMSLKQIYVNGIILNINKNPTET